MKNIYEWNPIKDMLLRSIRGVGFQDVIDALDSGNLLAIVDNANQVKYPWQKIMIIRMKDYGYRVPYERKDDVIFLKTIIPSRKETKFYKIIQKNEKI